MFKVRQELCSGCGNCADTCPTGAISLAWGTARIDQHRCNSCGLCEETCPQRAIVEFVPIAKTELAATVSGLRGRADDLLERIERLRFRGGQAM